MHSSRALHANWINPPTSGPAFAQYIGRIHRDDHEGYVVGRYQDDAIVGVFNLNNIIRGTFLSATMGYYVGAPYVSQGYMLEGLELLKQHACSALGLHRLEANIQPTNTRSINLVKRGGFSREGLAPGFLYIDERWRDHERWSYVHPRVSLLPETLPESVSGGSVQPEGSDS
jgi:ribosomal-protein-alanine N-acetyltransferase